MQKKKSCNCTFYSSFTNICIISTCNFSCNQCTCMLNQDMQTVYIVSYFKCHLFETRFMIILEL